MPAAVIVKPVGLTAVSVLPRNRFRQSMALTNPNIAAIIYWSLDDPAVSVVSGFPLFPKASITFTLRDGDDVSLSVWAVSDLAGQEIRAYESVKLELI